MQCASIVYLLCSALWWQIERHGGPLKAYFLQIGDPGPRVIASPKLCYWNADVAYLMQNSHPKIQGSRNKSAVIPSLMQQAIHLNRESCRFESLFRNYTLFGI